MEESDDTKQRGRPAMDVKPILIRLKPAHIEKIDALRGDMSRAEFIRKAIANELFRHEAGGDVGEGARHDAFVNLFGGITWREPDGTWRHKFINPITGEVVYTLSIDKEPSPPIWG